MNIISKKNIQGHLEYLLTEEDRLVLKLVYKPESHIARVETEKERRVLLIQNEGLIKTLLVLKNEYGIRIGSLNFDNFSVTHGSVDIENTKYRFQVSQATTPELNIYKGSKKNLVYSCQFPVQEKIAKEATASLIIAVSWYLFLHEEEKQQGKFTEAIIL